MSSQCTGRNRLAVVLVGSKAKCFGGKRVGLAKNVYLMIYTTSWGNFIEQTIRRLLILLH